MSGAYSEIKTNVISLDIKNDVKTMVNLTNKIMPITIQYNSVDSLTIYCQICQNPDCPMDAVGCK